MTIHNPNISSDDRESRLRERTIDAEYEDDTDVRAHAPAELADDASFDEPNRERVLATPPPLTAATSRRNDEPEHSASYLPNETSEEAGERWQKVQAEFVDDPRKSVAAAHELVGDLVKRITDSFTQERDNLEHQWSQGENVSTEDLRVCLQRYRTFFSRLLPSANGLNTH